jgi:hypothetical protein
VRVIRLSDLRRRRQRSAAELDAALEQALELRDLGSEFEAQLRAADALADAYPPVVPPGEAVVALRAAIAARKAATERRRTRRIVWQTAPGAVAAGLVGVLAYVGVSGGQTQQVPQNPTVEDAAQTIRVITQRMEAVQRGVAANDPAAASQAAQQARDALVAANEEAAAIPAAEASVRDLLLKTADLKIAELQALLAQIHLPPLPPLPPIKVSGSAGSAATSGAQASGPSSSTTTSSSTTEPPPSSTTTSSSSTTTSTTQGGGVLATASGSGKGKGSASTTTTSPAPSSSSSSSSTTTSTTAPPPPSTTSTTAPEGP